MSDTRDTVIVGVSKLTIAARPWSVRVGRDMYGNRTSIELPQRFATRARADEVAAFLAGKYAEDGRNVIIISATGKETRVSG
jgi:hypothetical protein